MLTNRSARAAGRSACGRGGHDLRGFGKSKRGSALLTVLWLSAALAAIGFALATSVRGETERASTNVDDAKSYFIACGAIDRAALHMQWGPDYYTWGQPAMDLAFPDADVHVDIVPESSKLGLNFAPPDELMRLLLALGVPEDRAGEIVEAIVDWRTPVSPDRLSPFDAFYLARSPSFLPRHTSFTENEELLLVKGITPDLYYGTSLDGSRTGLRDCVSPNAFEGAVDINTARAETMIAVGLSPQDAEAVVKLRATHPILDYRELGTIQTSLGVAGQRLREPGGRLSDMRRTVAALVKFFRPGNKAGRPAGFDVVRWFDRG